jgi:hypothetical protein
VPRIATRVIDSMIRGARVVSPHAGIYPSVKHTGPQRAALYGWAAKPVSGSQLGSVTWFVANTCGPATSQLAINLFSSG